MARKDTPTMRATKIEVLEKAKTLIEERREEFICHAISTVNRQEGIRYSAAAEKLKKYILRSLQKEHELGAWLLYKCKHRSQVFPQGFGPTELRRARVQWIEWMIASLREEQEALEPAKPSGPILVGKLDNKYALAA